MQQPLLSGPFDLFDSAAQRAMALAQAEATSLNQGWIGTEHLVVGIVRVEDSVAAKALASLGVQLQALRDALLKVIPRGQQPVREITLTPRMHEILARASVMRTQEAARCVTPEILLRACIADAAGVGTQVLTGLGATPQRISEAIAKLEPPKAAS